MGMNVDNTMADHRRARGHVVTPGITWSACSCGHTWTHITGWVDKYRAYLRHVR